MLESTVGCTIATQQLSAQNSAGRCRAKPLSISSYPTGLTENPARSLPGLRLASAPRPRQSVHGRPDSGSAVQLTVNGKPAEVLRVDGIRCDMLLLYGAMRGDGSWTSPQPAATSSSRFQWCCSLGLRNWWIRRCYVRAVAFWTWLAGRALRPESQRRE